MALAMVKALQTLHRTPAGMGNLTLRSESVLDRGSNVSLVKLPNAHLIASTSLFPGRLHFRPNILLARNIFIRVISQTIWPNSF